MRCAADHAVWLYQRQFSGISLPESLVHTAGSNGTVVALVVVAEEAPNHRTDVEVIQVFLQMVKSDLHEIKGPFDFRI